MKYIETQQWWDFLQCENFQGADKVGLPETADKCARTVGFDLEETGISKCAGLDDGKGEEGLQLLRESVNRTLEMGVT